MCACVSALFVCVLFVCMQLPPDVNPVQFTNSDEVTVPVLNERPPRNQRQIFDGKDEYICM